VAGAECCPQVTPEDGSVAIINNSSVFHFGAGFIVELSTMPTSWTLTNIEAAIFVGLVLVVAGAGTWASAVG
jgi:hypothetical protein